MSSEKVAQALRALSIDAIEKAKSGHPGAPLGMADIASELWLNYMNFNPKNPNWQNRDRFILSNGHASALLYSILHLTGYQVSLEDIKNFRQLKSKTPGHPEINRTHGVEISTGPLGQGMASAVGFALAEKLLATLYNKANYPIIDHRTFVFVGDGCLMEGLSQEALSLANVLELGKLIVLYDDNGISIDGNVQSWFKENTPERFRAAHWHVIENVNGHDTVAIKKALDEACTLADSSNTKPILICFKTTIGFGSPHKAGSASSHGAPLGTEELMETKKALGIDYPEFTVPDAVYKIADKKEKGQALEEKWNALFAEYKKAYPDLAEELSRRLTEKSIMSFEELENILEKAIKNITKPLATRVASQEVLSLLAPYFPELLGGSADLSGSVGTVHKLSVPINNPKNNTLDFKGNYLHYGVREFAMTCIMNGLSLYKGFIPYGGTFLVFSDYSRSAIRLSALMKLRVIHVLTHDSIGVGEDGPTHQPVEHVSSLRLIPDLSVWRPADALETAAAWLSALQMQNPTALILSRQNLPQISVDENTPLASIQKGGYIVKENSPKPEYILLATGSELSVALEVYNKLALKKKVRLVSMPCTQVFDRQSKEYKEQVLPASCTKRIAIEAGCADFWYKYVGLQGKVFGISTFGESAPASALFTYFGLTEENIYKELENYE